MANNCSSYLSKITSSSFEAVGANGDWSLDLVGLQNLENFREREDVHHFAHHVLIVVIVVAEITSETVYVLFAAPFFIAKVGKVLQNPKKCKIIKS